MENEQIQEIEEVQRDPTLDQPALTYHEVCLPWAVLLVRPEVAERVIEAMLGPCTREWVRVDTVTGSVVYVRTEHVVLVRDSTPAQRASELRLSNALREEWRQAHDDDGVGFEGIFGPTPSNGAREEVVGLVILLLAVLGVSAVAASVTSWIWMIRATVS